MHAMTRALRAIIIVSGLLASGSALATNGYFPHGVGTANKAMAGAGMAGDGCGNALDCGDCPPGAFCGLGGPGAAGGGRELIVDASTRVMITGASGSVGWVLSRALAGRCQVYGTHASHPQVPEGVSGLEVNISCPNVREGGAAFGTRPDTAAAVTAAVSG